MAKYMGTKKGLRHPHLTNEHRLIEYSIGAVKDKCKHLYNDPYAKRKHSDKCTKPDARACAPLLLNMSPHFPNASFSDALFSITCPLGMPSFVFFSPLQMGCIS